MAAEYEFLSEHSGDNVDSGVSKGLSSIQSISINGAAQSKDSNGNVDLPAYPTTMPFNNVTGEVTDNTKLNTALTAKQNKNIGSANSGKILYIDSNGDIAAKDDPLTATWGNITGTIGNQSDLVNALATKVDNVLGKGLSTNDYDNTEKAKVDKISDIEAKIPSDATSSNQLADKQYVADQMAYNNGSFRGLYTQAADMPTTGNTNNDYAHVNIYDPEDVSEIIGYTKYKWVASSSSWLKECDVKTNNFSTSQNNAINSGVTSAKVATYDAHVNNINNPHNVTASQIGLGNVANVGSSATPVSGGTDNFTTGGAYTNFNLKADKANTIGSHTMADNITSQNLLDDIKDLIGTFTRKVIDGASNTLSNIALSSLANLGSANAGKPIVVGNDGDVVVGDNVPTYLNISDQISENTYNAENGTFNHCKMVLQNDMVFYNVDYNLNNAITEQQTAVRKVMELPNLSGQFSYPSKINVRITQAVCQPTSEEGRAAYYDPTGGAYVDPTIFSNLSLSYNQIVPILEPCFSDAALTKPIYIARQNIGNNNAYYWSGSKPIVIFNTLKSRSTFVVGTGQYDFDVLPYTSGEEEDDPKTGYYHATDTEKWYYQGTEITITSNLTQDTSNLYYPIATSEHLNNYYTFTPTNQVGPTNNQLLIKGVSGINYYILKQYEDRATNGGYNKITSYFDQTGTSITLPTTEQYWEVIKVNLTVDPDYLYKAHLSDIGCRYNTTGQLGKYTIDSSLYNEYINPISNSLFYSLNHGAFGTATFTLSPITSKTDILTQGSVINNTLYLPGIYCFDRLQIGAGGVM